MRRTIWLGSIALLTVAVACGGDDNTSGIPDACNPLGGPACLMPWPSSVYLDEANTATGYQVNLPPEAMPVSQDDKAIKPEMFNGFDGFGLLAPILVAWETGVSPQGLPSHQDWSDAHAPNASVVVVNMSTNERLTIFAEVDMNTSKEAQRALIIRPLERMKPGTRYAVGIRKSVKAADGSDLPITPAFQALLDGTGFGHPLFDKIAPGYDAIFTSLAAAGVPKEDLVLAWDFVTASDESVNRDLLHMRDTALPLIGTTGENLSFTAAAETSSNPNVYQFVHGNYQVPSFLTSADADPSIIARDASGLPMVTGMDDYNFSAVIPACVTSAQLPLPVIVFGHGLFGNAKDSIDDGFLTQVANDNCAVIIGTDFIGLTDQQLVAVAIVMNDLNKGQTITEKLAQSVINFIALGRISRGPLRTDDLFKYNGAEILDPTRVYYYGASLGGNMGGVVMAYEPDITRGVLAVAGGPWSMLFERSLAWPPLQAAMKGAYNLNPFDYQQNVALMGWLFETVDPASNAHRIIADPLPNTPAKQIFHYIGLGDTLVTNIASDVLARQLGVPVISPSVHVPYGATETTTPVPSAMAIYDEEVTPWPPLTNVAPSDDNGTHSGVNERPAVQRQVTDFLMNGTVGQECFVNNEAAPCSCSTGACD